MGVLVGIGKALFRLGLLLYIFSLLFGITITGTGMQVPPVMSTMMNIFKITGVASVVSYAGVFAYSTFFLKDTLIKSGMLAFYVSMVVASIGGIITALSQLLSLFPLPPNVILAFTTLLGTVGSFSIGYYAMYQLGYLPEE